MRTSRLIKPNTNFALGGLQELDIRIIPKETEGRELAEIIHESIRRVNSTLITELPSWIRMTQVQFAALNGFTDEMYHTTDRMFSALDEKGGIICVMEVAIDREIDTVEQIDDTIEEAEAQLEYTKGFAKLEGSEKILTQDDFNNSI
jgi:hypothetical protein